MGQHLHVYASAHVSLAEAQTWCNCRRDELHRAPTTEEAPAYTKVSHFMHGRVGRQEETHYEAGDTAAVRVWSRLWWDAFVIDDDLIAAMRQDVVELPAVWQNHPIFEWMTANKGLVGWGDNDGI